MRRIVERGYPLRSTTHCILWSRSLCRGKRVERSAGRVDQHTGEVQLRRGRCSMPQFCFQRCRRPHQRRIVQHVHGQEPSQRAHDHAVTPAAHGDPADRAAVARLHGFGQQEVGSLGGKAVREQIQGAAREPHRLDLRLASTFIFLQVESPKASVARPHSWLLTPCATCPWPVWGLLGKFGAGQQFAKFFR